jgi:signal transduction histidine kinase
MARRFSHEMHDELGQSLSALRRMLSRVSESDVVRVRQEALMIVDEVLQSVRKLSQVLRPVILDDFGLDSGLRWLCDRFTERTQISVTYSSDCSERLAENAETHLFRIAQEALTNIARHAEATNASVSLRTRDRTIELEVMDNGRGIHLINEAKAPSLGMVGMRARARQLGGELLVQNQKKGGLRLVVQVPREPVHCDAEQENSSSAG